MPHTGPPVTITAMMWLPQSFCLFYLLHALAAAIACASSPPLPSSPLVPSPPKLPPPPSAPAPLFPSYPSLSWSDWLACQCILHEWKVIVASRLDPSECPPRPLVTLAYAQSLDGCLAAEDGTPTSISGPPALVLTHDLRALHDCILIGSGTLESDNPQLNVRYSSSTSRPFPSLPAALQALGSFLLSLLLPSPSSPPPLSPPPSPPSSPPRRTSDPRPILLLPAGRGPLPFNLLSLRLARAPVIFTPSLPSLYRRLPGGAKGDVARALALRGYEFVECAPSPSASSRCDLGDVLRRLGERWGYRRVMVEGGPQVLSSFMREHEGLVDVCVVTVKPGVLEGGRGLVQGRGEEGGGRRKGGKRPVSPSWLMRLEDGGRGQEGGRGWTVRRLGGDMVLVGRPSKRGVDEDGGGGGGKDQEGQKEELRRRGGAVLREAYGGGPGQEQVGH
ncbi:hypothetical protein NSK_005403 [Nannochloropsis salina CCMP1776]|uniref:Bacterial bifunctional deaminase-reductase C-terminal domain-containing protein n=1 Tax=Nannochloropsis salina CCMP1776 TaxID=1027361 RepID=A0A4D9D464_9STRA|nr:hypothetical protein NSK_005403 [Nannochloropsis salina CCMP1776]|eukprot:TFJ83339.1 hypothetical protein NSK_005403 [Nannochloropsis salina CCMP1776]